MKHPTKILCLSLRLFISIDFELEGHCFSTCTRPMNRELYCKIRMEKMNETSNQKLCLNLRLFISIDFELEGHCFSTNKNEKDENL